MLRVGGLETNEQCGAGLTLEAAGRGLGYSSTLLLAGYLPGGGCHIPFQKAVFHVSNGGKYPSFIIVGVFHVHFFHFHRIKGTFFPMYLSLGRLPPV